MLFNETQRKPLLPPVDFGAKLFAGLSKDVLQGLSDPSDIASNRQCRRRAYTDVNDLLVSDLVNNQEDPDNAAAG